MNRILYTYAVKYIVHGKFVAYEDEYIVVARNKADAKKAAIEEGGYSKNKVAIKIRSIQKIDGYFIY